MTATERVWSGLISPGGGFSRCRLLPTLPKSNAASKHLRGRRHRCPGSSTSRQRPTSCSPTSPAGTLHRSASQHRPSLEQSRRGSGVQDRICLRSQHAFSGRTSGRCSFVKSRLDHRALRPNTSRVAGHVRGVGLHERTDGSTRGLPDIERGEQWPAPIGHRCLRRTRTGWVARSQSGTPIAIRCREEDSNI